MAELLVAVTVSQVDITELEELARDLGNEAHIISTHIISTRGFNGEWLAQLVISISAVSPILIAWITSMAERQKAVKVEIDGRKYEGLKPADIILLDERLRNQDASPQNPDNGG